METIAPEEKRLRDRLCRAAHHLWQDGQLPGVRGSVAVELHRRRYLITPAGRRRGDLHAADLATVDLNGADVRGGRTNPRQFWPPHRLAFEHGMRQTPEDVRAGRGRAVTATALSHCPRLLAFAVHAARKGSTGVQLRGHEPLPVVDPHDETALAAAIAKCPVVLLPDVGVFASGAGLDDVVSQLEDASAAAALTLTLRQLGGPGGDAS